MNYDVAVRRYRESKLDAACYEITPAGRRRCIDPVKRARAWDTYLDDLLVRGEITQQQRAAWRRPWGHNT